MATRKKRKGRPKPRPKTPKAPPKKRAQPSRPRSTPKRKPAWAHEPRKTTRAEILRDLRSIAGSLSKRLKRQPTWSTKSEIVYLRAIANLKAGKRISAPQQRELLQRARPEGRRKSGPILKKEVKLLEKYQTKKNRDAFRPRTFLGVRALVTMQTTPGNRSIFYQPHDGKPVQRWSVEGFQRFMALPAYAGKRDAVLESGTFWFAKPGRDGDMPKKGRKKFLVE